MELREWLIILGLALVTIIVIDGVRRLQRQRRVPRLDQVDTPPANAGKSEVDPEQAAREAEINWELPNGGARVVKSASDDREDRVISTPKPKLQRQDHPGPSRVLASWRRESAKAAAAESAARSASPNQPKTENQPKVETSAGNSDIANKESHDKVSAADAPQPGVAAAMQQSTVTESTAAEEPAPVSAAKGDRAEPTLSALDEAPAEEEPLAKTKQPSGDADDDIPPLAADPDDHEEYQDGERYRLVDLDGMTDSLRSRSVRAGTSMQRFGASMKKSMAERKEQRKKEKLEREKIKAERQAREASRKQQAEAEKAARMTEQRQHEEARQAALRERQAIEAQDQDDPLFVPSRLSSVDSRYSPVDETGYPDPEPGTAYLDDELPSAEATSHRPVEHPLVEKVLRHAVSGEHARDTLSHAEEVVVISVMSRNEDGFSGPALLELMLACGLRYSSEMGIFHRFETEDPESELQFSMVNVVKPGTFPLESMEEFQTPGITLLMPLPGAVDSSAAFEAMVETAMVVVRHLGGELKDENRSVMTAQTVEFARQRVQDFERRHRLHRYQAN